MKRIEQCSHKECLREARSRGLCRIHYLRLWRRGELNDDVHVSVVKKERRQLLEQGKMRCTRCDRVLTIEEFPQDLVRKGRHLCKACHGWYHKAWAYGLSQDQFRRMRKAQLGRCAICNLKFKRGVRRCCVDHKHSTGQIRGLLCSRCNKVLGAMRDNAALFYRAAQYLDEAEVRASKDAEN